MVFFKHRQDAAQHELAVVLGGLVDLDELEAAREGGIFLEVLFVFGPGGCGEGTQFPAGESGLEEVGCIALASLATGTDHGVSFVDEKDDWRRRSFHFVDQTLEAIFEFALDACASLEQREVEGAERDVFERRRNVAGDDAKGKAFDDGRLSDPRFADENRIVLAAAGEDVDHLANFKVAGEDAVDLAVLRVFGEVDGVGVEVGRLRIYIDAGRAIRTGRTSGSGCVGGTALAKILHFRTLVRSAADGFEIVLEALRFDLLELFGDIAHEAHQLVVLREGNDAIAGTDVTGIVVERSHGPCFAEHLDERGSKGWSTRIATLQFVERSCQLRRQLGFVDVESFDDGSQISARMFQQLHQEVFDLDIVMRALQTEAGRGLHGVARGVVQFSDQRFYIDAHQILR